MRGCFRKRGEVMPSIKSNVGNSTHVSLDEACVLIHYDDEENEIERQVFCSETSVSRQEFSAAGRVGIRSSKVILVDSDEYDDQEILKFNNRRYYIYRNYRRIDGYTELNCEVRAGV